MAIQEIEQQRFPPLFKGLPKEVPFKKGDILKVDITNNPNYRLGKLHLVGKKLTVKECYRSDIGGNMSVYIVKFEQQEGLKIENPYLAHHFDFYEDR